MRKRISSIVYTLLLLCSIFTSAFVDANASDSEEPVKVDGSYLTHQDSAYGSTKDSRASNGISKFSLYKYLMDGECSITKSGSGKIYVYAGTTASVVKVDYILAIVYVDYYDDATGKWFQVGSWNADDADTYYVSTGSMMTVTKGRYYRVRGVHIAGMVSDQPYDYADTISDGIYIN